MIKFPACGGSKVGIVKATGFCNTWPGFQLLPEPVHEGNWGQQDVGHLGSTLKGCHRIGRGFNPGILGTILATMNHHGDHNEKPQIFIPTVTRKPSLFFSQVIFSPNVFFTQVSFSIICFFPRYNTFINGYPHRKVM